jgi:hypothetical protein
MYKPLIVGHEGMHIFAVLILFVHGRVCISAQVDN